MFSIKGIYKDKKLHLKEPLNIEKRANVIITFLDKEQGDSSIATDLEEGDEQEIEALQMNETEYDSEYTEDDEYEDEEYYEKLRKHKRYKAHGTISLILDDKEVIFSLRDYSAGGLSFISDRTFDVKRILTASLKDPIDKDVSVLDFEFEVMRVITHGEQYIIGCKFFDEVDEELWHSLIS